MKKFILPLIFLCVIFSFPFNGISQPKKVKNVLKDFSFCDYEYDDFEEVTVLTSEDCGGSSSYFVMSFGIFDDGEITPMKIAFKFKTNFVPNGTKQSGVDLVKARFGEFNEDEKDQSKAITFPMESFELSGPKKSILGNTWVQNVTGTLEEKNIDVLIDAFSNNEAAEMRGYARVATEGDQFVQTSENENIRETVRDKEEFTAMAKFLKQYRALIQKTRNPYDKPEEKEDTDVQTTDS